MNIRNTRSLAGTALLLAMIGSTADAQTFFPNDATINYAISENAAVGYANATDYNYGINPTSPTVSLVSGDSINGNLLAYNSSTVNISGGSIGGNLYAFNSSTVNFSGGNISTNLGAYASSTINLFGSSLTDTLINPNYAGSLSQYALYGTLADGTALNGKTLFVQNGTAKFTLNNVSVPAPSSALVALAGMVPLVGVLRKRHK